MDIPEVRWYKGKLKVKVLLKSNRNWLVEDENGNKFVTYRRLLWRNEKA